MTVSPLEIHPLRVFKNLSEKTLHNLQTFSRAWKNKMYGINSLFICFSVHTPSLGLFSFRMEAVARFPPLSFLFFPIGLIFSRCSSVLVGDSSENQQCLTAFLVEYYKNNVEIKCALWGMLGRRIWPVQHQDYSDAWNYCSNPSKNEK